MNNAGMTQKITQSTHENGYIKPRKTFWRNSKQLLTIIKGIRSLTVSIKASFLSRILWNCPKKKCGGSGSYNYIENTISNRMP